MYSRLSPLLAATPPGAGRQFTRAILARPHGEYTDDDIATVIVPAYVAVCASVGLDAVMLLAQLIHETGNLSSWWAARPRRNPAGIGVTGRTNAKQPATGAWAQRDAIWVEGVSFASWERESIPAHVGRLLAYARTDAQASPAQLQLIRQALAVRGLPAAFRGVAQDWSGLNGRWAVPGRTYADKIAAIANRIVEAV